MALLVCNFPRSPQLCTGKAQIMLPSNLPGAGDGEKAKQSPDAVRFLPSALCHDWVLGLLLVAATIFAYQPAWHGGRVWDDDKHITQPGLRSLDGLVRIWTEPGAVQQYYPLAHSVFWIEHKFWGDATTGYHLVNILLHAFSALLLVRLLRQLGVPGAWLAAAIFALHPVEVESVAWISELKNTLSGVFYLSAALAYLGFDRNRNPGNYAAALTLFLLGLMSKSVIATLPAALLVIFWWQRGKLSWKRDVLPLAPFFIVGIGAGLFTAWVERRYIGAQGSEFDFSLVGRFLIAGRAVWFYLGKLLWPVDLAFVYPRWLVNEKAAWQYVYPAAALLLFGLLAWQHRDRRGPVAAMLFFVGTLFPALGFLNVYPFRFSFVADHFQYLAGLGPLTLAAAGIATLPCLSQRKNLFIAPTMCAALLVVLGTLTWAQCRTYATAETLWQSTLRLNPDCWMANYNLGLDYLQAGRLEGSITHFQKAAEINPDDAQTHNNLGFALLADGRIPEAVAHFEKALVIQPAFPEAYYNMGRAFLTNHQPDVAIDCFQHSLALKPNVADINFSLGETLLAQGRASDAAVCLVKALELRPAFARAHEQLAEALLSLARKPEAIAHFRRARQLALAQSDPGLAARIEAQLARIDGGSPTKD
jgi:protein O-mannosyl-transferase